MAHLQTLTLWKLDSRQSLEEPPRRVSQLRNRHRNQHRSRQASQTTWKRVLLHCLATLQHLHLRQRQHPLQCQRQRQRLLQRLLQHLRPLWTTWKRVWLRFLVAVGMKRVEVQPFLHRRTVT